MKKKVFYQHHIVGIIVLLCLCGIFSSGVYVIVDSFVSGTITRNWWIDLIILIALVYIFLNILSFAKHRIVFDEKKIFVPGDWQGRNIKVQYKMSVSYKDIIDFKIIKSANNSKNETITANVLSSGVLKPYLELTLRNGDKQRAYILFFTKKQRVKIIDELKRRLIAVGNNIELPSTAEMIKAVEEDKAFMLIESMADKTRKLCQEDSTGKLSDYFTYDEFCDLFVGTYFGWKIEYKGSEFVIEQTKKRSSFYNEADNFRKNYEYPEELLEEVMIEGHSIKALWNDLYLYSLKDTGDGRYLYSKDQRTEK